MPTQYSHWLRQFLAIYLAQMVGSFAATSFVNSSNQAIVLLVAFPLITALLCTAPWFRTKYAIVAVVAATFASVATIHGLRKAFDSTWFFGPCPSELELPGYGILALITVICSGLICAAFASAGAFRKLRWYVVGLTTLSLIGLAILAKNNMRDRSPSALLRLTAQLEQQSDASRGTKQELNALLSECGRETDAESILDPTKSRDKNPHHSPSGPVDLSKLKPLPWRETFTTIAQRERLIIIMEAHNAPKHRQWIEQTLPILRQVGFHDYAAEALSESGRTLKQRGYPVATTGTYVADPQFGNLLRTAIVLGFDLHTYEAYAKTMEQREYGQAANLAKLFSANPNLKLVIHAGYGHIFKTYRKMDIKMMAAYLWEMTGIEPYCIWQTYHSPDNDEARQLADLVPSGGEPVMLVPPPAGLSDTQFQFPPSAIDAIVVHPPSIGGPTQRVHAFKTTRERIAGTWQGAERPVLIGAFKKGESADAVALDQIMLRDGEKEFVLWIPPVDYEIRIFNTKGRIEANDVEKAHMLQLNRNTGAI
jgi:hypothetical protein